MPILIIPNAFRVAIEAQSGARPVTNVVGVLNSTGTALGAAQAVQTAWKVAAGPLALLPAAYVLQGFRATDLASASGEVAFVGDTQTGGASSGAVISTNAASALIKFQGGTRSRSSSGRMYFGPQPESAIGPDGRTLVADSISSIGTAFAAFRSSLTASGYPLVVLSPTLSTASAVSTVAVEPIIATQRRRIRG